MTAHSQQQQQQQQRNRITVVDTTTATTTATPPPPPPMLILVGRPGIGKSTTVHCLARELGFQTHEWTESSSSSSITTMNDDNNNNPMNSFQQFLQSCASDLKPLPLLSSSSSSLPRHPVKRGTTHSTTPRATTAPSKKLILLDELPYTHTSDAQWRLRHMITTHITTSSHQHRGRQGVGVPTILIVSDTTDGPASQLERFIDSATLSDPQCCRTMTIQAPTRVKFRHALQRIVVREAVIGSSDDDYYDTEEFYERCRGDLRYAITTLQCELIGNGNNNVTTNHHRRNNTGGNRRHRQSRPTLPVVANTTITTTTTTTASRMDSKLAPFHALGKLLYAKRRPRPNHPITTTPTTTQHSSLLPPLEFCPDAVMQQTDMELPDILYFLSYHSVDFFSDINDLSSALTYFSDTNLLYDTFHGGTSSSNSTTLQHVATSMAGRVVAHTNRHPAPSKFRSLNAPKVYDMIRKRRGNQDRIEALSHASWCMDYHSPTNAARLVGRISARTMAMDWLPYRKMILPHHHVSTVQWDSMFGGNGPAVSPGSLDVEDLEMWKEQEEILKADDIIEENGDEDGW